MRIYPVKVKDEQGNLTSRKCVDLEDLLDEMVSQELSNYNVLENWHEMKVVLSNAFFQEEKSSVEEPEHKKELPEFEEESEGDING